MGFINHLITGGPHIVWPPTPRSEVQCHLVPSAGSRISFRMQQTCQTLVRAQHFWPLAWQLSTWPGHSLLAFGCSCRFWINKPLILLLSSAWLRQGVAVASKSVFICFWNGIYPAFSNLNQPKGSPWVSQKSQGRHRETRVFTASEGMTASHGIQTCRPFLAGQRWMACQLGTC